MTSPYRLLAERIQGEVPEIERVVQRASTAWSKASRMPEEELYLDAVALNLHGFYAGVERLFELIARRVDHNLPASQTWHRDLLQQMAQDIPDMRPAVIGQGYVGLPLRQLRQPDRHHPPCGRQGYRLKVES